MSTILLVEDNEAICMGLEFLLTEEKYTCVIAHNKREAKECMERQTLSLVLLDVSLPDGNGFDLCREIKEKTKIPVIFLTAKDEERDVVQGFDLGADDYVIKPFRNRELISRIRNVLRRNTPENVLACQDIRIDTDACKVYRGRDEINVTKLEYKILVTLFSDPKKLFTRDEMLERIWDMSGNFVNDNTLTVTMKRIREKIGDKDGSIIQTVRGMGYRLGDS